MAVKYVILSDFADKYDITKVYKKGETREFPEFERDRIKSLIDRKIIAPKADAPKTATVKVSKSKKGK